jgi:hypothetical protein
MLFKQLHAFFVSHMVFYLAMRTWICPSGRSRNSPTPAVSASVEGTIVPSQQRQAARSDQPDAMRARLSWPSFRISAADSALCLIRDLIASSYSMGQRNPPELTIIREWPTANDSESWSVHGLFAYVRALHGRQSFILTLLISCNISQRLQSLSILSAPSIPRAL